VQLSDRVQHAEKSVREIASLNQAFSAAIFQQAEQIETLYNEAVQASENIQMGNVQLEKKVRVNKSSRKCLLFLLFVFSLALLFVDWFYS
jgi:syntaxin 18